MSNGRRITDGSQNICPRLPKTPQVARDEPLDAEVEEQVLSTLTKPSRDAVKEAAQMTGGKTGKTQVVAAKKLKAEAPDLFV